MFRLELLPAATGDAIRIEYGNPEKPHRIVIDGGPAATYESGLRRRVRSFAGWRPNVLGRSQ